MINKIIIFVFAFVSLTAVEGYDPSREPCGVTSSTGIRIIGGTQAYAEQYPWLALIEYKKDKVEKHLCGGTLIGDRYVLTAAHCVTGDVLKIATPTVVRLGEYNKTSEGPDCVEVEAGGVDCTEGAVRIPIERIIPHPEYEGGHKRNDIALIQLKTKAPYTEFIRPICLPKVDITLTTLPESFSMIIAGWGTLDKKESASAVPLQVSVPYVNLEKCKLQYSPITKVELWSKQICAGGHGTKDFCRGNSGGALTHESGGVTEAIGIMSFGPTECASELPTIYTKVYDYKDWILSNMAA